MSNSPPKRLQLERLSHVGPVTAVAFTPDDRYVVYASGQNVVAHDLDEDKEVCRTPVFERNRVHGIHFEKLPEHFAVLLWGATSFAYSMRISSLLSPDLSTPLPKIEMEDWILDARCLDSKTIALVTAHNSLLLYNTITSTVVARHKCVEQSLLYAAQLFLTRTPEGEVDDILVAAGTVFNEIQLWRPPLTHNQNLRVIPIKRRLKGHEGCIFSLRFNEDGTLLASCSDDRTIRVWDVDTGLQLAIGFAHIARVWDVRFVPGGDKSDDNIFLFSNSEDTTAIFWSFSKSSRRLKVRERYQGHRGKHVWSQAVSSDGTRAITGGNDGGINVWDITGSRNDLGKNENSVYWKEWTPAATVNGKEKRDLIKGYRCLDNDQLLITTGSGCVYLYSLSRKAWTLLLQDEKYRNYGTVASVPGMSDWVCLGNSKGGARLFNLRNPDEGFEWSALDNIIMALYTTVSKDLKIIYIFAYGASRSTLSTISFELPNVSLLSTAEVRIPYGFEVTTFAADPENKMFFLGSRQGAIACYLQSRNDREVACVRLIGSLRRVHDHEGVRSMRLQKSSISPRFSEILTTGRNGVYQILRISLSDQIKGELPTDVVDGTVEGVEITYVHRSILNRGWLEGSAMVQENLLLWGFHSKTFHLWNESTGELVFEHDCGGANRIWDFYFPNETPSTDGISVNGEANAVSRKFKNVHDVTQGAWLMYTSKSELHFRRPGDRILHKSIRKGNHGREIRCLTPVPTSTSTNALLLASGSEDTYINFTKIENNELEFVHRKKQFNTGVQALVFSKDGRVMFSSAGQKEVSISPLRIEGRDIISVEFGGYSNFTKFEEQSTDNDDGGDLRIMGIDVRDEIVDGMRGYLVALVLSDSTVKLYWIDPGSKECVQVASGRYTMCCLLGCKFIFQHNILLVTATDGNVAFFQIPPISLSSIHANWSFCLKFTIHQSSVKSMDLFQVSDSVIYLLTGGDDNAVHLTKLDVSEANMACTPLSRVLDAHTSTVTGVLFLGESQFVSVSIDQKIKIWKMEEQKLECIYEKYTFVPDVCGIAEIGVKENKRRFVVYGTGVELLELQDD